MSPSSHPLMAAKQQWLFQQVEVEFPTKESLEGRALYLEKEADVTMWETSSLASTFASDDIFLVDFHRLTILFAQLQSMRWSDAEHQALIIEFLTQIIYSPPCELYLACQQGRPLAGAIVTRLDNEVLISDLAFAQPKTEQVKQDWVQGLIHRLGIDCQSSTIYIAD
ncbi:flavodoxin [Vibrio olivae]|uniref:Flavodoxin n=1 Tax=Vibrio olivae TaxID=1243002 RepID=A0ABV5HRJ6_9VIBR